jgi:vacuolar protein sorting-associated protein 13A/C
LRAEWFSIQVPWKNLRTRPVVVELGDVYLEVSERPESHWEEDAASQRKMAAKRATLASKELEQLSKPAQARQQDGQEGKGSTWWLLSLLGQRVMNHLQLNVRNVHLKFQVRLAIKEFAQFLFAQMF